MKDSATQQQPQSLLPNQNAHSSINSFVLLGRIGHGSFSQVYKVRRITDGKIYALKRIKLASLKSKQQQYAISQIKILAALECPYIISFRQSFYEISTQQLCIVMEWANEGDLQGDIQKRRKSIQYMSNSSAGSKYDKNSNRQSLQNKSINSIPQSQIWRAARDILSGLAILHDASILHRDIKTANIFKSQGIYKLGDLNIAKICPGLAYAYTQTGTPYYASPQVWKQLPYDTKSDIWSFGCVIYEMCQLNPPFMAADMSKLYDVVIRGKYRDIDNRIYSRQLSRLIEVCLRVDPKERKGCRQILGLEWVKKKLQQYNILDIDIDVDVEQNQNQCIYEQNQQNLDDRTKKAKQFQLQLGTVSVNNNSSSNINKKYNISNNNHICSQQQLTSSQQKQKLYNKQLSIKLTKQLRQLRSITQPTQIISSSLEHQRMNNMYNKYINNNNRKDITNNNNNNNNNQNPSTSMGIRLQKYNKINQILPQSNYPSQKNIISYNNSHIKNMNNIKKNSSRNNSRNNSAYHSKNKNNNNNSNRQSSYRSRPPSSRKKQQSINNISNVISDVELSQSMHIQSKKQKQICENEYKSKKQQSTKQIIQPIIKQDQSNLKQDKEEQLKTQQKLKSKPQQSNYITLKSQQNPSTPNQKHPPTTQKPLKQHLPSQQHYPYQHDNKNIQQQQLNKHKKSKKRTLILPQSLSHNKIPPLDHAPTSSDIIHNNNAYYYKTKSKKRPNSHKSYHHHSSIQKQQHNNNIQNIIKYKQNPTINNKRQQINKIIKQKLLSNISNIKDGNSNNNNNNNNNRIYSQQCIKLSQIQQDIRINNNNNNNKMDSDNRYVNRYNNGNSNVKNKLNGNNNNNGYLDSYKKLLKGLKYNYQNINIKHNNNNTNNINNSNSKINNKNISNTSAAAIIPDKQHSNNNNNNSIIQQIDDTILNKYKYKYNNISNNNSNINNISNNEYRSSSADSKYRNNISSSTNNKNNRKYNNNNNIKNSTIDHSSIINRNRNNCNNGSIYCILQNNIQKQHIRTNIHNNSIGITQSIPSMPIHMPMPMPISSYNNINTHQSMYQLPKIRNMLLNRNNNIRQQIGKLYYNYNNNSNNNSNIVNNNNNSIEKDRYIYNNNINNISNISNSKRVIDQNNIGKLITNNTNNNNKNSNSNKNNIGYMNSNKSKTNQFRVKLY